MKTENKGNAIADFFDQLFTLKGRTGKLVLNICPVQTSPETARCVGNFSSPVHHGSPGRPGSIVLPVGTSFNMELVSVLSGYATLINFGSDGNCLRLVPWQNEPSLSVRAGQTVGIRDPELVRKYNQKASFRLQGPSTEETGLPERFLAIVSQTVEVFDPNDLSRRFVPGVNARAGFGGGVDTGKSRLFSLPLTDWEFGYVSCDVTP